MGIFDGNGKVIKNMSIDNKTSDYIGLIGFAGDKSTIKNVTLEGSTVSGKDYVGGIVGNSIGKVIGCVNKGSVTGSNKVGGIVGVGEFLDSITDCKNTGSVKGNDNQIGGIVGYSKSLVSNCVNTGSVTGSMYVGGIVGESESTLKDCYTEGSVKGSNKVGGIVGTSSKLVNGCYNIGSVTGSDTVGGIAGYKYTNTISNCYNSGLVTVTGNHNTAGGITGSGATATISNCYNTGSVKGAENARLGGIVGSVINKSKITNCYNIGVLTGSGSGTRLTVSGIATIDASTIEKCYFLKDTDINTDSTTVAGATAWAKADFNSKSDSSYGWVFGSVKGNWVFKNSLVAINGVIQRPPA